ncbi:thermonuclease [Thiohalobacter thiocyanaticus]|uniref:Thermonuclease n=1 Tax=Thiohalobacter thiocyanaticus TaxID=585455 RepID=A0A1Z4VM75_9GAMM|nr:thermonuclease family protein [Thiohalobacter thiocyanaticus]BAZ92468.1 thermonuclease [Thiohalobacter thiocyanaticus]
MTGCALVAFGLLTALAAPAADTDGCLTERIDERVRVSQTLDGDTLALQDGRRLRLIGINAPELGHDGAPHEPGALAARDVLRRLVFLNRNQLGLRLGREREDRYGRLLAHAFLDDGRNLTALMLEQGQGFALTVPPNTWQATCYHATAARARSAGKGLWRRPDFRPRPAADLPISTEGFRFICGRVTHVSDGQYNRWINLQGNVALRIARTDLKAFGGLDWKALPGREIEASGWIYQRRGQLRLQIRHPLMLTVLGPPPGRNEHAPD